MFILCASSNISAQVLEKLEGILSPNATSLGEYGETQVSLYTGSVNVSIPLYELIYGDATIPISLSYKASGVKPDQHPGWVGLGWNLNAGGMISRKINDLPDDYSNYRRYEAVGSYISEYLSNAGFYFRRDLDNTAWNSFNFLKQKASDNLCIYDTEPDEFSFNFLNYSGKFYRNFDGTWNVQCDNSLQVEVINEYKTCVFSNNENRSLINNNNYNTTSFGGFQIKDDKGIRYVFGNTDSSIEYSINFFNQGQGEWYANSWMLTKIILPNNEEITFEYERKNFVNQMYVSYLEHASGFSYSWSSGFQYFNYSSSNFNRTYPDAIFQGQLISPVYLKKIITPANTVNFISSPTKELRYNAENGGLNLFYYNNPYQAQLSKDPTTFLPYLKHWDSKTRQINTNIDLSYPSCLDNLTWYQLDDIYISNAQQSDIKGYTMEYSRNPNQRLTLFAVKEHNGGDIGSYKAYSLKYYNMESLPQYLELSTDHWGYFNNTKAEEVSNLTKDFYRRPATDLATALAGTLQSITYPTGGVTEFIYEQHRYSARLDENRWAKLITSEPKIAGGLRIKSTINYPGGIDNNATKFSKSYDYGESGILEGITKYSFTDYDMLIRNRQNGTYSHTGIDIKSSQSVLPCTNNSLGCHIGYSRVTETSSDGSRIEYKFTNFDSSGDGITKDEIYEAILTSNISPYSPCNLRTINRGLLTEEIVYSTDGAIKMRKGYKYKQTPSDKDKKGYVRSMYLATKVLGNGEGLYDEAVAYKIFTYSWLPEKITETYYDMNHAPAMINEISYEYNSDNLVSKMTSIDSEGKTLIKRIKYVGDAPDGNQNILCKMKKLRLLSYPVQETESVTDGSEQITGAEYYKYAYYNPTDNNSGFYKLWSENRLAVTSPVTNFLDLDIGAAELSPDTRFKEHIRYNSYDPHGNPQFITKDESENIVYLWGYNYQHPLLEARNTTMEEVRRYISSTEIEEMGASCIVNLDKIDFLRVNLPNSLITSYIFNPSVGLRTVTFPNKTRLFYEYDRTSRLSRIYRIRDNKEKEEKKFIYHFSNF